MSISLKLCDRVSLLPRSIRQDDGVSDWGFTALTQQVKDPIVIRTDAGKLPGYDFRVLITSVITVHEGKAYLFGFETRPSTPPAIPPTERHSCSC